MKGRISDALAAEAIAAIVAAIAEVRRNLPFLLALSPAERKSMLKLGPKSVKFVSDIKTLALAHPELVPSAIDLSEFEKDAELVAGLGQFASDLDQVAEGVDDTMMVAGSEALSNALVLYGILQHAAKTIPGLDETVKQLGRRWKANGRPKTTAQA